LGTYTGIFVMMTSFVLRTQSVSQCSILPRSFLLQLALLNSIASYQKSEQVQQVNVFKRQTLAFHFSSYPPNSFIDLSHHTPVRPYERIDCCDCSIGRQNNMATRSFLVNNAFSTMSKLFTPNIYYWSRKYLSPYTGCISD